MSNSVLDRIKEVQERSNELDLKYRCNPFNFFKEQNQLEVVLVPPFDGMEFYLKPLSEFKDLSGVIDAEKLTDSANLIEGALRDGWREGFEGQEWLVGVDFSYGDVLPRIFFIRKTDSNGDCVMIGNINKMNIDNASDEVLIDIENIITDKFLIDHGYYGS